VDYAKGLPEEKLHYDSAAKIALKLLRSLKKTKTPKHTLLNLNVPDLPLKRIKGIRLTRQGFRYYSGGILRRKDHRGKDYYWVGGQYQGYRRDDQSDCAAVERNYASLTPIKLDATDLQHLVSLSELWPLLGQGK
jgi:5'-nucleotidase